MLAAALSLRAASRAGNRYGRLVQGELVPETVSFQEIQVGRFEVTQTQFAQFDPKFRIAPGRENFPVSGITFPQAKAYCEWLSKLTGDAWRLPNATEADTFYNPADDVPENTLNHWAGYAPNPEDAGQLRREMEKLGGAAAFLHEVGTFRGRGDETLVFDLGGNVAEWTTDQKGLGTLRGGSADAPCDAKTKESGASLPCQGFRVVKESRDRK
jgi:formylglycine-generating enzyme required for sulfatase activity